MKELLLIALLPLALMTTGAQADEPASCEQWEALGRSLMQARQEGASLTELIKAAPDLKPLIIEAYDTPRFNGESMKQRAIDDFAEEVAMMCYEWRE